MHDQFFGPFFSSLGQVSKIDTFLSLPEIRLASNYCHTHHTVCITRLILTGGNNSWVCGDCAIFAAVTKSSNGSYRIFWLQCPKDDEKLIFCLLFSVIASKHSGEQIVSKISWKVLWKRGKQSSATFLTIVKNITVLSSKAVDFHLKANCKRWVLPCVAKYQH